MTHYKQPTLMYKQTASIAQYLSARRYFPKFERAIFGKKSLSFVSVEYDQGCMETL